MRPHLIFFLIAVLACSPAFAATDRVACSDKPFPEQIYGNLRIVDWRSTVCLEQEQRIRRLQQATADLPPDKRPQFYSYMIPATRLPIGYGVDMPVLRVVFPDSSYFETDRTEVLGGALPLVAAIAQSLRREVPDVAVFVAGHTDNRASEPYNLALSVRRAESVSKALTDDGIGDVALWQIGFGEDVPIADNETVAGMASNRRVEFLFAARTEAVARWLEDQNTENCLSGPDRNTCVEPPMTTTRRVKTRPSRTYRVRLASKKPVAVDLSARIENVGIGVPKAVETTVQPVREFTIPVRYKSYTVPVGKP